MGEKVEISGKFLAVMAAVAIVTAAVVLVGFDAMQHDYANKQVYAHSDAPFDRWSEDIRVGQARLQAELGFMHMDLAELKDFFARNITYQADLYTYQGWKLPSLFVAERGGDCEDYVLFALAVLNHSQYQLKPMLGTFGGDGHAFLTVTEQNGTVWLVDSMNFCVLEGGVLPSIYHADTVLDDMLNDNTILGLRL